MPSTSLVLGTAGHIDHGKSTLVKALTHTDPDRLAEEKLRGITIELGFANLELPSGKSISIVDVPGHERFVRQMVSGTTGIDLALLVIAADDGIMPQTIEHAAVLELLHISKGIVALTKADLVDEEWLAFMKDEIDTFTTAHFGSTWPTVAVSSVTGNGIDELKQCIDEVAKTITRPQTNSLARMPLDRAFTLKGIGTVVTGTLWSGKIQIDDELELYPSQLTTSVRSIQMHNHDTKTASAGNRVALNLRGITLDQIKPGDFIATPNSINPSDRFDAQLTYADPFQSGKPLKSGVRVHVAHGTRETLGRVLLMNGAEHLNPGETALAQIRLEQPLPLSFEDRFIIRSYSPVSVIGGGIVLAPHPRRRTTLKADETALLDALTQGDTKTALQAYFQGAYRLITKEQLIHDLSLPESTLDNLLDEALQQRRIVRCSAKKSYYAHISLVQKTVSALESTLLSFHHEHPQATGISKEALRHKVNAAFTPDEFDAILVEAMRQNKATSADGEVSHPQASAGARMAEKKLQHDIMNALIQAAPLPLSPDGLSEKIKASSPEIGKALSALIKEGAVVKVAHDTYYAQTTLDEFALTIRSYLAENTSATAAQLKEALHTSRKYAMPLLEYFDEIRLTKREGDLRFLYNSAH